MSAMKSSSARVFHELRASAAVLVAVTCMILLFSAAEVDGRVRHYEFNVVMKNITRLCSTKAIVTVNGKFPGPTLYAREGDNVVVRVVNHVRYNVTVHWHGIRQLRTGWSDGPAYITQCPIRPGGSYVYNFNITDQRGTLWWHAHILWLRATVHGALVVFPKRGHVPYYPFPKPYADPVVVLGEWWKTDVETAIDDAMRSGLAPNVSDGYLINGLPGDQLRYPHGAMTGVAGCGSRSFVLEVKHGKTYLLRIVNAVLNSAMFFKVAGHRFTVVEVDAVYTQPFVTDVVFITPGQTTTVLLKADQHPGTYLVTASPFEDSPVVTIDNTTATAILRYVDVDVVHHHHLPSPSSTTTIHTTTAPAQNATPVATTFEDALRSLNSQQYPAKVPLGLIDRNLFFTVGMGLNPCPTCTAGVRLVADINNLTFTMPTTALLQAHYFNRSAGVFTADFPSQPPVAYNYTGNPPANVATETGTKVYRLPYNSTVQLVLQDTAMLAVENHPIHLHGFNVFVVGKGIGNYDPRTDPANFNLVDPVERNTIGVPSGGWTAIRFRADNPGVWFLHCHLEAHMTWGLRMAFLVDNGQGPDQSLLPPPRDLPAC